MKIKITREELRKISESQSCEFKSSLNQQKNGFESLTAMVNSETARGMVIFGVDNDGGPKGIEPGNLDSAQRKLAEHARNMIDPPLICNIKILECEDKTLIAIDAQRLRDIPFHEYDGRTFIREGSSNRQLSFEEKKSLIHGRSRDLYPGPWRCDRCGSFVGLLVSYKITNQGHQKSYQCHCGGEFWPV